MALEWVNSNLKSQSDSVILQGSVVSDQFCLSPLPGHL